MNCGCSSNKNGELFTVSSEQNMPLQSTLAEHLDRTDTCVYESRLEELPTEICAYPTTLHSLLLG